MDKKMKDSHDFMTKQFQNSWRLLARRADTLFYSALAVTETAVAIRTGQPFELSNIPMYGAIRELVRFVAWENEQHRYVIGSNGARHNPKELANDAITTAMALGATKFVATSIGQSLLNDPLSAKWSMGFAAAFGTLTYVFYERGDGLKSLIKNYGDVIWDYNRKRDMGGLYSTRNSRNDLMP